MDRAENVPLASFEAIQEAFIKKQVRAFKMRKSTNFHQHQKQKDQYEQTRAVLQASVKLIEHRERDRELRDFNQHDEVA